MIILALGSNLPGVFGPPRNSINKALDKLIESGIQILSTSRLYRTQAHGYYPQPDFLNAIATAFAPLAPDALLRVLKEIEAQAGRRESKWARFPRCQWRPRPLDLDIVSYKDIICNWKMKRPVEGNGVILPHPRAHERAFVLKPLSDVAPFWHHPVFGLTAPELLKRTRVRRTGAILAAGEFLR